MTKKTARFGRSLLYDLILSSLFILIFLLGYSRADNLDNSKKLFSHILREEDYESDAFAAIGRGGATLESVPANDSCAATLSNDLSLDVPIIIFHGQSYWADFKAIPDTLEIQMTNYGLLTDTGPFNSCQPSSLSPDLMLHIPKISFNGGYYLADFEYSHYLSLTLIGVGQKNKETPLYKLSSSSIYQEGCVSPCLCPITVGNIISGTFKLIQLNPTPLFKRFSLDEISWAVINSDGEVVHTITGFGIYQIAGEFAMMHQLVLEVSIDNNEQTRFDSALISDGSQFPGISIWVDRGTECYDILMGINASQSN